MLVESKILSRAQGHMSRHIELKGIFDAFAINVRALFHSGDGKELGVTIEPESDPSQMTLNFCGMTVLASFSVQLSESSVLRGKITFLRLDKFDKEKHVLVEELDFDGQAMSDAVNEKGERFNLLEGAGLVLLQVLSNALPTKT